MTPQPGQVVILQGGRTTVNRITRNGFFTKQPHAFHLYSEVVQTFKAKGKVIHSLHKL